MADPQLVTQEEMALRRRARRRLVGAVAIALAAVVVLPMLFDSEPKPLGPDVDLNIPAKDSPFETGATLPPAAPEPPPLAAEPTLLPPPPPPNPMPGGVAPTEPTVPVPKPEVSSSTIPAKPAQPAAPTGAEAKPKPKVEEKSASKAEAKPTAKVETKPESKPDSKPEAKSMAKPESKPAAKSEPVQGNKGYILQLGAFGSEANARQLLDKVQAAGFKAGVSSANGQFRVRVGPIQDHDKALETQNRLKAKGFSPVLMGP